VNIGILVPLPQELSALTVKKIPQGSCERISGNVLVCLSGVGKHNTMAAFEKLVEHRVDIVISWGSAAGLTPEVRAGDLLIPQLVNIAGQKYPANRSFCQQLLSKLPSTMRVHVEPIAQTEKVLLTVEDKMKSHQSNDCIAADMESGTLAQLAGAKDLPFAVIRAVSDTANTRLPKVLIHSFRGTSFDLWDFMLATLTHPGDWGNLIRLAKSFKKARESLRMAGKILLTRSDQWTCFLPGDN
jgi:adenosylhomocysteine nucleosidase